MPQLHFNVPAAVADQLRARARALGMSVSRYLAQIVGREVGPGWPTSYFAEVVGGWQGEPLQRRRQGSVEDRGGL